MGNRNNEIKLLYHGQKQRDKEVLGYARSLTDHQLNETDISTTQLTARQLAEIADDLGIEIEELVDKHEGKYREIIKKGEFSDDEWLKLLVNNPELIRSPIAYINNEATNIKSQYSLIKQDMNIGGVKSEKGNKFEK